MPLIFRTALALVGLVSVVMAADPASVSSFLVTNNDVSTGFGSTATFYSVAPNGSVSGKTVVSTGGIGIGGGFFAASRLVVVPKGQDVCVFASNAGTSDIAGINAQTHKLAGNFQASSSDIGLANGISLAANASYLYAGYTTSSTIATFKVQTGCTLSYVNDLFTVGLSHGVVGGMAIRGSMMVVTYGDGSIESFNISAGTPVSNGDAQNSTGSVDDHFPNGVDITQDGHFAIFGDASTVSTVEVSDISSGKLMPTVAYNLAQAWNSGNVRLSPDETVIYVSNDSAGRVTAARFNKSTGKIVLGCTSPTLKGFYSNWAYVGAVALQQPTGTGGLIYVPEFGSNGTSSIGILQLSANGAACLTEVPNSPINDTVDSSALLSIGIYPGRPF